MRVCLRALKLVGELESFFPVYLFADVPCSHMLSRRANDAK